MRYIGAHVSTAGGVDNAMLNARDIGANAAALFTRNPRSWASAPLQERNIAKFKELMSEVGIQPEHIIPHDSYLINVGSPKPEIREKSIKALRDEVKRADLLGVCGVNFHPGAHLNMIALEESIALIAQAMNEIIVDSDQAVLIIENTAGQGSTIGRTFAEIAHIISLVDDKSRVGVCLDTCHLYSSGYDIKIPGGWGKVLDEFAQTVGLKFLKGMHINDSKGALGSHIDRHNSLGAGEIGWDCFRAIIQDERIKDIPLILETIDPEKWPEEIRTLRSFE